MIKYLALLTTLVGTPVLAQEQECKDVGDTRVCPFTLEESPACHKVVDFPNPNAVADFYGGVPMDGRMVVYEGKGGLAYLISTPDPDKRYMFFVELPTNVNSESCMIAVITRLDPPA